MTDTATAPPARPAGKRGGATRVAPRRSPRHDLNPSESRRSRALLAGALLLLAGLITGALLMAGKTVRVPALQGLDQAAARVKLQHLDLRATFGHRYDAAAAPGTVIVQRPAPTLRVSEGTRVQVILSAGRPPLSLPQLVGRQRIAAQAIVARLGLRSTVNLVPAPGATPGFVVQQIPAATTDVPPHSQVTLAVAEAPRWRSLDSFGGRAGGASGPFVIRGSRWRIVESVGRGGRCTFIFFCSGPRATITNASTGATLSQFDLREGAGQTRVFVSGPGTYEIRVTPGSNNAHWSIQVLDDY